MVFDMLGNFGQYVGLNPYFPLVERFIREHNLAELELGTYNIKDDDVVLKVELAIGKRQNDAVLESHRLMIDVQIPLQQPETFGLTPVGTLPPVVYSSEKDISFYPEIVAQSFVTCPLGGFVIFFPQDAHAPCISQEPSFKKAIFKVRSV